MTPPLPRLLLITDSTVCSDLVGAVSAALEGGVTHILFRAKNMATDPFTTLAKKLLALTTSAGAYLLVHARIDVALAIQAAGVHLPESGISTANARQRLDAYQPDNKTGRKILGRSCHSVATACDAIQQGADFVTLSPLFVTHSHPKSPPLGLQHFSTMRAAIPGPVLAMGGIHQNNAVEAIRAGADGVALIRGILGTENPRQAAATILSQLISPPHFPRLT